MTVGCVKELKKHEYRVGLTPGNAKDYIAHGHSVWVQRGAGEGSGIPDEEYISAGAHMADDAQAVWERADLLIKVKEPLEEEYRLIRSGQIIYTYFHLAADRSLTEAVLSSGCKAVAYETVTDKQGNLPLLTPMSEIAGRLSIQAGARCLEKPYGGRGVLLGGVPGVKRAKVVILGAGVVGANACKVAIGMNADVTIMDVNLDKLRYLDDIYGNALQTMYSSEETIRQELAAADLVIGSVLIPGGATPKLIRREHLKIMRPGSVIVDVAVDQGGCCETSRPTYHDAPTFVVDGVIHYCVGNMPGATPRASTFALTNATLRYGLLIADHGLEEACRLTPGLLVGINAYLGNLTCRQVGQAFGLETASAADLFSKS